MEGPEGVEGEEGGNESQDFDYTRFVGF